ncbi:hypothetical protein BJX99DRAFT_247362 [Aspergillus californicus]
MSFLGRAIFMRIAGTVRWRGEETGYILKNLRSGEQTLYLQEVPRVKASHCRAWDCAITRLTHSPIIISHYRFALKGGENIYKFIQYYYITYIERLLPNLAELVVNGHLKLDGWFKHRGHIFNIQCYKRFKADHEEWTSKTSICSIKHQLRHENRRSRDNCYYYKRRLAEAKEPVKSDYFPTEPGGYLGESVISSC